MTEKLKDTFNRLKVIEEIQELEERLEEILEKIIPLQDEAEFIKDEIDVLKESLLEKKYVYSSEEPDKIEDILKEIGQRAYLLGNGYPVEPRYITGEDEFGRPFIKKNPNRKF